jgi:nitrogen fixation/metabolism regulation signal transduction histidine kinase
MRKKTICTDDEHSRLWTDHINVILIILLIFLIIRNVVKLFYEHRRGIIGAKLRTKLVAAFVGLSLVPTIYCFYLPLISLLQHRFLVFH